MADVLPFPTRERFSCADAEVIRFPVEQCPACKGRGVILYKGAEGFVDHALCPCGGDDENRIDLGPDFGGAA